jgi:hypothetical protein
MSSVIEFIYLYDTLKCLVLFFGILKSSSDLNEIQNNIPYEHCLVNNNNSVLEIKLKHLLILFI